MKKFLGIILVSVFSVILTAQAVQAHDFGKNHDHDNDTDDHHPITFPVTSPVTSPVLKFFISGDVTYREWGNWFRKFFHISPASGVTISAKDKHTHVTLQTTTDSHGHYSLSVGKGDYTVSAHDNKHTLFVPQSKTVSVTHHNQTADFQGLLWK